MFNSGIYTQPTSTNSNPLQQLAPQSPEITGIKLVNIFSTEINTFSLTYCKLQSAKKNIDDKISLKEDIQLNKKWPNHIIKKISHLDQSLHDTVAFKLLETEIDTLNDKILVLNQDMQEVFENLITFIKLTMADSFNDKTWIDNTIRTQEKEIKISFHTYVLQHTAKFRLNKQQADNKKEKQKIRKRENDSNQMSTDNDISNEIKDFIIKSIKSLKVSSTSGKKPPKSKTSSKKDKTAKKKQNQQKNTPQKPKNQKNSEKSTKSSKKDKPKSKYSNKKDF